MEHLQTSNPAEFKQVCTDGAAKLRDGAKQETDPTKAAFLNKLADRFQNAADTGDFNALKPLSSFMPTGHHHHHYHAADPDFSSSLVASAPTES